MSRRPDIAFFAFFAFFASSLGCSREPLANRSLPDASPSRAAVVSLPEPEDAAVRDAGPADPWSAFDCAGGEPRAGKSVGHTSVVFKLELTNGTKVAFKPHSRKGPSRYKGEIAAYRLGRALDLPNVMPACFRTFPVETFANALAANADASRLFREQVVVESGVVRGALIPWFSELSMLPLEKEPLTSEFRGWLRYGAPVPDDRRELARQASTLVAFDFVTGNWDRWSGANVGIDKTRGLVLFIDNDGAFFASPPKDALARSRRLTSGIDRFSKSFLNRLRVMSDADLAAAIGEESPGTPLLSRDALAGVLQRRRELLEMVDAKTSDASADAVLYFP